MLKCDKRNIHGISYYIFKTGARTLVECKLGHKNKNFVKSKFTYGISRKQVNLKLYVQNLKSLVFQKIELIPTFKKRFKYRGHEYLRVIIRRTFEFMSILLDKRIHV